MDRFILCNVILKRRNKSFGMFRRQNYPRFNLSLWYTRHYSYEIDNKFRSRVSYYSKVGISTLTNFFVQLDIDLCRVLWISHSFKVLVQFSWFSFSFLFHTNKVFILLK